MTATKPERTIAIGDIHGCIHALEAIVEAVAPGPSDLVVCLGDFIDFGRDTRTVIDTLLDLGGRCRLVPLLGNHEEMLLAALGNEQLQETWLLAGGVATLDSYRIGGGIGDIPRAHLDFIRSCRDFFETEHHVFVHANYDPDKPFPEQPGYLLRWALLDEHDARPHRSAKTVIVGHTEQPGGEILDLGFVQCIDTHCHRLGWLTALDVTHGQIWQSSRWGVLRQSWQEHLAPPESARP